MSTKLDIAVIGGGLIGPRHAACVLKSPETTLIALVDPAPHGNQLAADLNTTHYPTVAALLASPHRPYAAIICTPNHTHVAVATELVHSGVHVLVEKPLSTDTASGAALLAHAHNAGVKLLVGTTAASTRTSSPPSTPSPRVSWVKSPPSTASGRPFKPPSYFNPPTDWRRGRTGGVVLINLVHEIDLLHHLLGPSCACTPSRAPPAAITMPRRARRSLSASRPAPSVPSSCATNTPSPWNFEAGTGENPTIPRTGESFYRIFGTEAALSVPDMTVWSYGEEKSWAEPLRWRELDVVDAVPFELQLTHFVRVVRGEEEPGCGGEAGLRALVVCEAVRRALRTGETVDVRGSKL